MEKDNHCLWTPDMLMVRRYPCGEVGKSHPHVKQKEFILIKNNLILFAGCNK